MMNWSEASTSLVRGLLFFLLLLFGLTGSAVAQKKSAPAPSHSAPAPSHPAHPSQGTPHPSGNTSHANAAHTNANTAHTNTNTAHTNANTGHTTTNAGHTNTNTTHTNTSSGHTNPTTGTKSGSTGTTTGSKTSTNTGHTNTNTAHTNTKTGTTGGAKTGTTGGTKTSTTATTKSVNHPGGGKSVTNAAGHTTHFNSAGSKTGLTTKGGTKASFDHSGHVSTIHTKNGMTINHGAHGERRYESRGRNGGRVVGYGHGHGYGEHGYYRGGRPYMRRTYYYGGRSYAYAYRGYYWHGGLYYGYVPPYYYGPRFYGWAYNPWPAPIVYGWGWGPAPWYGYYGYYFAPAPVYPYPALWLTDFLLAANLQAAYAAQAAAADSGANVDKPVEEMVSSGGGLLLRPELSDKFASLLADYFLAGNLQAAYEVGADVWAESNVLRANGEQAPAGEKATLSPEVKQEIANEVKAQIAAEKEAAAHPEPAGAVSDSAPSGGQSGPDELPAALDPAHRIFIVSAVLSETMADGTDCSLSPGDVLNRVQDTPDADKNVKVLVASSQKKDCPAGSQIPVAVQDLQDMHNDFRAKITEGLGKLAENQGKNGLPTGPPAESKANPAGEAKPDPTVAADLKAQESQASQAEKEVQDANSINN